MAGCIDIEKSLESIDCILGVSRRLRAKPSRGDFNDDTEFLTGNEFGHETSARVACAGKKHSMFLDKGCNRFFIHEHDRFQVWA